MRTSSSLFLGPSSSGLLEPVFGTRSPLFWASGPLSQPYQLCTLLLASYISKVKIKKTNGRYLFLSYPRQVHYGPTHTKFNEISYCIWSLIFSFGFHTGFSIDLGFDFGFRFGYRFQVLVMGFRFGYGFQVWLQVSGLITIFRFWLQFSGFGTVFRFWLQVPGCPRILYHIIQTIIVIDCIVSRSFGLDISTSALRGVLSSIILSRRL